MADLALQVENLSKMYRRGSIGTGSLRQDLHRWWTLDVLKKDDPFFTKQPHADSSVAFWALKDINLQVNEGEVLGIIGHNGAGKSTLLKIMSRIIKPTSGIIKGKGRVSSLLEVGTGFHQELSGRENIFLSGYILGMKKKEIQRRFDEIVSFAGIDEFLDTPVKRYSSGMYVRLAFSVAAHLEPDILIVDEVLAVGDAEFQKKCLGKMKEASSGSGRTVIFVSHNMQAVNQLCDNAIWLHSGRIKKQGQSAQVVNAYLSTLQQDLLKQEWPDINSSPGNAYLRMSSVELNPDLLPGSAFIDINTSIEVIFRFYWLQQKDILITEIALFNSAGDCIFVVSHPPVLAQPGELMGKCIIPGHFLNDGNYYISIAFFNAEKTTLFYFEECLHFTVADIPDGNGHYIKWWGYVRPQFPYELNQLTVS